MNCALIGGSIIIEKLNDYQIKMLDELSAWLVSNNVKVLTGACGGFPHIVGKMCVEKGGEVIGYSPATNMNEHELVYNHPVDGCSHINYSYTKENDINARFLIRSIPLINDADVVISIEGNWGTLFELITGVICGKKIIIWKGFGGVTDDFEKLYKKYSAECHYNYGDSLVIINTNSVDELLCVLKDEL